MIKDFDILQPWSTFVLATTLPSEVLERMIKLTDEIIIDRAGTSEPYETSSFDTGAAQVESEFMIDVRKFAQEEAQSFEFLMEACGTYVKRAYCQSQPFNKKYIMNEQWMTELISMWVVSQKDNEYNPIHVHEECHLSAVMYLKIPEYSPNPKTGNRALEDGAITFTSNVSIDPIWGIPNMTISPKVGQFFIFPASLQHGVYPFKTLDGKGERRSLSFNTIFENKPKLDRIASRRYISSRQNLANNTKLDRIEKEKGGKI